MAGAAVEVTVPGAVALGGTVSVLASILVLAGTAAMAAIGMIPERLLEICVLCACVVGCLFGGRLTAGRGRSGFLYGTLVGLAAALALGVSGFLLYSEFCPERCAAVSASCLLGGGLSGLTGSRKGGIRKKQRS